MPTRRTRQPPAHNLSWFSAPQCWTTLCQESNARNRRRLEEFRHHIRVHDINRNRNQTTPSTPWNQPTPTTLWTPELRNTTAPPSAPTSATHYHRQSLPPSRHHAPPTRRGVSGFLQNNQLYSRQWQRLEQILHQHDPQHTETCNSHPPSQTTIDTQDR
jgi:hypothetical protein